jgi:hypothetical protein
MFVAFAKYATLAVAFLLLPSPLNAEAPVRSWWPLVLPAQDSEAYQAILAHTDELIALLPDLEGKTVPEKADAVRLFLNNNSQHLIDDEFYNHWENVPYMMAMIKNNALGQSPKPPHMECATRSTVMHHMLNALGIKSRFIVIHHKDKPGITHTFLEIYDPARDKWSMQDPDGNIYWIKNETGRRARVEDMLRLDVEKHFTPCQTPDKCGYDDYSRIYIPYFALSTRFHPYDSNEVKITYSPARFNKLRMMRRLVGTPMFCALYEQSCAFVIEEIKN